VRGASALQKLLREVPESRLSVLIVWEPVILSDQGPPLSSTLSLVSDGRAAQFWDESRSLSRSMVRSAIEAPSPSAPGDSIRPDTIVWDFVAVFAPGAIWGPSPRPLFHGGPVVDVIEEVRASLSPPSPAPATPEPSVAP